VSLKQEWQAKHTEAIVIARRQLQLTFG
jgi:hypothetical protein